MISPQNIKLQNINLPALSSLGIDLRILRLDLIHPEISGNKWFKLKYNLQFAKQNGFKKILTFGGAYSNHIVATAAAGKYFGIKTIGIIRGELYDPLNHSLTFATKCGMQLEYVSREVYKNKSDEAFLKELQQKYPGAYIIPEGGANNFAIQGCAEINEFIPNETDLICLACGTGSTLAGIL
ncbi:MAG: 1-aminocyclopropane-1-carboxylate deaminase/D-cysteine desulfhydrase, partial [Bacteroidia bacterium]